MTYPLSHARGYGMVPRDVLSLDPLMKSAVACQIYLIFVARASNRAAIRATSRGELSLNRGECVAGMRELSELTGTPVSTVRRACQSLERWGLITLKPDTRGTVVTIVNYGDFPGPGDSSRIDDGSIPDLSRIDGGSMMDPNERERGGEVERKEISRPPSEGGQLSLSDLDSDGDGGDGKSQHQEPDRTRQDPSEEAYRLADFLRAEILARNPDHALSRRYTDATRRKWAQDCDRMHRRDGRPWRESAVLIRWVQSGCPGLGVSYVVESPKSLREKWDRISASMRSAKGVQAPSPQRPEQKGRRVV